MRIKNSQDIAYSEKKTKGEINKVIASLSGDISGKFTKLAKRYFQLKRLIEALEAKRESLNADVKEQALALFNAEDMVYTKIVETVSLTFTLSKSETYDKPKFDTAGYIAALEAKLLPTLGDELIELKKQYTTIDQITTPVKLSHIKPKVEEGVVSNKIKQFINLGARMIMHRLKNWDHEFEALKLKLRATM